MAKIALSNAFSINMMGGDANLSFKKLRLDEAKDILSNNEIDSHIGHADMANVVGNLVGIYVPMVRDTYRFEGKLVVAQYKGPRLPEGCTTLPEGSVVEFWLVEAC